MFEATEKVAGIGGPVFGGLLARLGGDYAPTIFTTCTYVVVITYLAYKWTLVMDAAAVSVGLLAKSQNQAGVQKVKGA